MQINKLKEAIREAIDKVLSENLTVKGKKVKSYKQNGDKSYSVVYNDDSKDTIAVSHNDWDKLNDAPKLDENAPAPSKPSPGPAVAPGKPDTGKPKPRRPLGNPDVKPAPKAKLKEEEMLKKIVARFKSKK
jgi:predicted Zn-dependent protease